MFECVPLICQIQLPGKRKRHVQRPCAKLRLNVCLRGKLNTLRCLRIDLGHGLQNLLHRHGPGRRIQGAGSGRAHDTGPCGMVQTQQAREVRQRCRQTQEPQTGIGYTGHT